MKRKATHLIALLTISSMLLSACGGNNGTAANSGTSSNTSTGAQTDASAGDMKLRILSANVGGKTPEENAKFEQEIKRLTGIDVTIERPASDYDQKVLTALGSGEKYDLIEGSDLGKLNSFIDQGALTDLTDFVQGSSQLSDPSVIPSEEWEQLKGKDDNIYAVFA